MSRFLFDSSLSFFVHELHELFDRVEFVIFHNVCLGFETINPCKQVESECVVSRQLGVGLLRFAG